MKFITIIFLLLAINVFGDEFDRELYTFKTHSPSRKPTSKSTRNEYQEILQSQQNILKHIYSVENKLNVLQQYNK
jgi:hypothetical protein